MENEMPIVNQEEIKNLIYTVRGKQVMLDSDVANLYHYKTKVLNLTVRRNIERFPEEFCFQITEDELESLRFQFETSNKNNMRGGRRYLPYVFTEQGIAMLSGVLKSEVAIKVSIHIIKAFIEMRKFISLNGQVFQEVVILTSKNTELSKLDINKFNGQYPTLKLAITNHFHDRFMVIDDKELYHIGASLKDLGKKCFAISKVENQEMIDLIKKAS